MLEADSSEYPVRGSDIERATHTILMNYYLNEACKLNGWHYLDTYSKYVKDGMLSNEYSDGTVHIKDKKGLKELLKKNINKLKHPASGIRNPASLQRARL
jgi:hypothetical protein